MKNTISKLLSLVLCLTLLLLAIPAAQAAGTVSYVGGAEKFLFAPGSKESPSDLFDGFKGVMPGDTVTQTVEVRNRLFTSTQVRLYLRAKSVSEDTQGFLSQLELTVKSKNKTIFEDTADQTGSLTNWVSLGTFQRGAKTTLELTLEVPITLDNRYQDAMGTIQWEFMAEEIPITDNPKTNDNFYLLAWCGMLCISAAVLILFTAKKKKRS